MNLYNPTRRFNKAVKCSLINTLRKKLLNTKKNLN